MEITYRLLETSDISAYRELRLECLKSYPENFGSTFEEESAEKSLLLDKILSKNKTDEFMMGAFADGLLVGICGFKQEGRSKTDHRGEIAQMFVTPSFSGKGIGKDLLKAAVDKAFQKSHIDQVTLGVVEANTSAVKLYTEFGFVQYARLENSFKDEAKGWTQLLMALTRERFMKNS